MIEKLSRIRRDKIWSLKRTEKKSIVEYYYTISAGRVMRGGPAEILVSACCQNRRDNFFFRQSALKRNKLNQKGNSIYEAELVEFMDNDRAIFRVSYLFLPFKACTVISIFKGSALSGLRTQASASWSAEALKFSSDLERRPAPWTSSSTIKTWRLYFPNIEPSDFFLWISSSLSGFRNEKISPGVIFFCWINLVTKMRHYFWPITGIPATSYLSKLE